MGNFEGISSSASISYFPNAGLNTGVSQSFASAVFLVLRFVCSFFLFLIKVLFKDIFVHNLEVSYSRILLCYLQGVYIYFNKFLSLNVLVIMTKITRLSLLCVIYLHICFFAHLYTSLYDHASMSPFFGLAI